MNLFVNSAIGLFLSSILVQAEVVWVKQTVEALTGLKTGTISVDGEIHVIAPNADLSGLDLSGANLSSANLRNANLRNADLSDVNLSRANLDGANFRFTQLNATNLSNAILANAQSEFISGVPSSLPDHFLIYNGYLVGPSVNLAAADLSEINIPNLTDLSGIDLRNANLRDASANSVNFSSANFSGADLTDASLAGSNFSNSNLGEANLSEAISTSANFSQADLSNAILTNANLVFADFSGANLVGVKSGGIFGISPIGEMPVLPEEYSLTSGYLIGPGVNLGLASLSGVNLRDRNLTNVDFSGANLSGADLTSATLTGSQLMGANLTDAYLADANLSLVNLRFAILSGARLRQTNFTNSNLSSAELTGADLWNADLTAVNLTAATLTGVRSLETASLAGSRVSSITVDDDDLGSLWTALTRPNYEQIQSLQTSDTTNTSEIEAIKAQLATLVDALAIKDQQIAAQNERITALETQLNSLGSNAAFLAELGEEFAQKSEITTAINEGKAQGINAVTSDPASWNVFTADQIQEMAIGDLVLTREENGEFVLNYEIQQSDDLEEWTTYSAQAETITGLPANKAFVRIRTRQ